MAFQDKALDGCTALVTGGSRGIGRAICVALAARGAKVAINYRSREDAAHETAELVKKAGGEAILAGFDVGDGKAAAEGVTAVGKDHGLHILVNNAGIAINGLLMRFKPEDWDQVIGVNLTSVFTCSKAATRYLLKAKEQGRIINLSSVVGESGNPGQAAYAAAKAGILGMTKSMAKEFASRGVTVNAVTPGFIATDMTDQHLPEDQREALVGTIPLARIGSASDVADSVAFLAGPEASYITGQVLRVNGGLLM
jgi:3-oxoacyl-[acyl-carrier protein] reductase